MKGGRSEGSGSMYQRGSEGKNDAWVCPRPDIAEVTAGRPDREVQGISQLSLDGRARLVSSRGNSLSR